MRYDDIQNLQHISGNQATKWVPGALHNFTNQRFEKKQFTPSTGIGRFDAQYDPSSGILQIVSKVYMKFIDVDPAYVATVKNLEDVKWTDEAKKEWKRLWIDSITTVWGDLPAFKCTKPGYRGVSAKPQILIQIVDNENEAHYVLKINKSFEQKSGGLRTGAGISGVSQMAGDYTGVFQEQDVYNKIRDSKMAQHLAKVENKTNILPAYERDRERLVSALSQIWAIGFRPNSSDPDQAALAKAASKITDLYRWSALADRHDIDVLITLKHGENDTLINERFERVKHFLKDAGVKNELRVKFKGVSVRPTATFAPANNAGEVQQRYFEAWSRYTSAHEFGHMLGLIDEYCPAESPELIMKLVDEGFIRKDQGKISQYLGKKTDTSRKQKGYAELLNRAGLGIQNWARPGMQKETEKSTSLMSGGFQLLPQHRVTLWEVLVEMTKDWVEERYWQV